MAPEVSRRFTRRRLLVATAVGVAGASAAVAVRSWPTSHSRPPLAPSSPSPAAPAPTPAPPPARTGGIIRTLAPSSFNFDTFDALHTGEPSVAEVLGRTHSRLVEWSDPAAAKLAGDLAISWEQPDEMTWIFRLNPRARWQDRPPLDGRPVVADDVATHFTRALQEARTGRLPAGQRPADLARIRRVTASGPRVIIETGNPNPLLLSTLASRFALIQAPEVVSALASGGDGSTPHQVVGSGPFTFDGFDSGHALAFRANLAGHRVPLVDGLLVGEPARAVTDFSARQLDEILTRDRRDAASIRRDLAGEVQELSRFEDSPVISSLFVGSPPWDNANLSGALNRARLAADLFAGRAIASGPVAPVHPLVALDETTLAGYPGYRLDADVDARDARAAWQAGGGPALGTITMDFPNVFDPLYSASSVVVATLSEVLGPQFRAAVDTYPAIAARVESHGYGAGAARLWFGWGPPFLDPDPSAYLLATYGSGGAAQTSFGFRSLRVASVVDRLASEFDQSRRAALAREASLALLDESTGGLVDWLVQRSEVFRWPHLRAAPPTPFWTQSLDANASFDTSSPSFRTRPNG